MSYTLKWILYLINKTLTLLSLAWVIYSLIQLITNINDWIHWLLMLGVGILSYVLSKVIYVIRKSYFPLPGRDYL
ncbi:MAG: hypothetical protein KKA84_01815 [Bacteroidetes bacterium]|nr:hypothetical protein [Bacteroidota bacterium]